MKGTEFASLLRVANCLCQNDFKAIFGESYEHYQDKLYHHYKGDLAKFIMYLDSGNVKRYFNHIEMKRKKYLEGA